MFIFVNENNIIDYIKDFFFILYQNFQYLFKFLKLDNL